MKTTDIFTIFLLGLLNVCFGAKKYEENGKNCTAKHFKDIISSFDIRSKCFSSLRIPKLKKQVCLLPNDYCFFMGEELSYDEAALGIKGTLIQFGSEVSLSVSHDAYSYPIPTRLWFYLFGHVFHAHRVFKCDTTNQQIQIDRQLYTTKSNLCCYGNKVKINSLPKSFTRIFRSQKSTGNKLHALYEIKFCGLEEVIDDKLAFEINLARNQDGNIMIDEMIFSIGDSQVINVKKEVVQQGIFKTIKRRKILFPSINSNFELLTTVYERLPRKHFITHEDFVRLELLDSDHKAIANYTFIKEDQDAYDTFLTIDLFSTWGNYIRKEAFDSILQAFPNKMFIPPIRLEHSYKHILNSKWLNINANSTAYVWNSGQTEEWIFQEVKSSLFPFLSHNITQLTVFEKHGGWESVIVRFPWAEASVYAVYEPDFGYKEKICDINFNLGSEYTSAKLTFTPKPKGFQLKTLIKGSHLAWDITFGMAAAGRSTKYLLKVNRLDVWTKFSQSRQMTNISASLANWPLVGRHLVELEIFNFNFVVSKVNLFVDKIKDITSFLAASFVKNILPELKHLNESGDLPIIFLQKQKDIVEEFFFLMNGYLQKITVADSTIDALFSHMETFISRRESEDAVYVAFNLENILTALLDILS